MSTTTNNFNLIKPELTDTADITAMNANWDKIDEQLSRGYLVTATSSDGVSYTATVKGVTELFAGLRITIIPDRVSATLSPTININSLGAKNIIMPIGGANTAMITNGATLPTWLVANVPVEIRYDGTRWRAEVQAQSASYMYGILPIAGGGTGADNAEEALVNLGGISKTLLWENSSVLSEFTAKTVEIPNLSNYSGIEIVFLADYLDYGYKSTGFIPYETYTYFTMDNVSGSVNAVGAIHKRTGVFSSETSIYFNAGMQCPLDSGVMKASNLVCIPYKIYGVKGVN